MAIWIVAHDAGGSEVLAAWIATQPYLAITHYILEGPAVSIFKRRNLLQTNSNRNHLSSIKAADHIYTTTSWQTDLEKIALKLSNEKKARSHTFLDHWCNYRKRFMLDGIEYFPDELILADEYAFEIAKREIPEVKHRLIPNAYFEEIKNDIVRIKSLTSELRSGHKILYACEAILESETPEIPLENSVEYHSLIKYLETIRGIFINKPVTIRLRKHPAETQRKIDALINLVANDYSGFTFEISCSNSLAQDLAWCDELVGMNSMALAVGAISKIKTTSCIDSSRIKFTLPFDSIIII